MLGEAMKNAAMAAKLPFFDAAEVITTDGIDRIQELILSKSARSFAIIWRSPATKGLRSF
jgi:hypothetical protein